MSQLIPTTSIETNNQPIVDATQHNAAVRLAKGPFQKLRRLTSGPLILLFLLAPWVTMNDAPILWMDLEHHVLHLFGVVFWPDDLLMLTWVAMASAFALFMAANIAGRIWCGFSCPQTVWSMMFIWVEEKTQGSRNKRLKELNKPLLKRNWLPFILKHSIWLLLAFTTGFTFVAYFETGEGLWQQITTANISIEVMFWLGFFSLLTYINAGWLREQVCLHMCPYARFQSVMVDKSTLKVSYDVNRGEPRKPKHPSTNATPKSPPSTDTGDCIDCQLCVQVCPVGIDIRQGLQYACIDCGACIDACDNIMESIHLPKGLIKFSDEAHSPKSTVKKPSSNWSIKARPRLWGYAIALLITCILFVLQVWFKAPYEFQLSRDRGQLYFYQALNLSNAFTLSVQNKTSQPTQFEINSLEPSLFVSGTNTIKLLGGQNASVAIAVSCITPCPLPRKHPFKIRVSNGEYTHTLNNVFFTPSP